MEEKEGKEKATPVSDAPLIVRNPSTDPAAPALIIQQPATNVPLASYQAAPLQQVL